MLGLGARRTLPAYPLGAGSRKEALPVTATTASPAEQTASEEARDEARRRGLTESVLDNLPVWTVIAAAIAFLYLVWATVEVLSRYVGPLPKIGV